MTVYLFIISMNIYARKRTIAQVSTQDLEIGQTERNCKIEETWSIFTISAFSALLCYYKSVGVSAFENSNSFDPTVTVAALASAKSDLKYVFAEDYATSGKIEPTTESGIISITGTAFQGNGVATSIDFSSFTGILNLGDEAFG